MRYLVSFVRFWWRFVVGDDWRVAAAVGAVVCGGALMVGAGHFSNRAVAVVTAGAILAAVVLTVLAAGGVHRARPDAFAVAVLALVLLVGVTVTWRTWGDLSADGGYDLYVASQVAEGASPYDDLRYDGGPLPILLLASVFRLFGVGLSVAVALGLALAAAVVVGTYVLARQLVSPAAALAAASLGAAVAVLAPGRFDMVLPGEWWRLVGSALMVWALVCVLVSFRRDGLWWSVRGGALTGLAVLAAPFPALVLLFGVLLARAAQAAGGVRRVEETMWFAGCAVGVAAIGYTAIGVGIPATLPVLERIERPPIAESAGTVWSIVAGVAVYLGLVAALVAVGLLVRALPRRGGVALAVAIGIALLALVDTRDLAQWISGRFDWLAVLAFAALLVTATAATRSAIRSKPPSARLMSLFVVSAVATAGVVTSPGRFRPGDLGAYLVPLAIVLLADFHVNVAGRWSRSVSHFGVVWLAVAALGCLAWAGYEAGARTVEIASPRGVFREVPGDGWAMRHSLEALQRLRPQPRAFIAPYGSTLLFLSGARSATGVRVVQPGAYAEAAAHSQLPDVALFVSRRGGSPVAEPVVRADVARARGLLREALPSGFTYTGAVPDRLEIEVLRPAGRVPSPNAVTIENARLDGLSSTAWRLHNLSSETLLYATATSVDVGAAIELRVATPRPSYRIDVWRAGWYGAPGVMRRFARVERRAAASGAAANHRRPCNGPARRTGLLRCPWQTTDRIDTTGWVSGVYMVNVIDDDGGMSQTVVVVRDDQRRSDVLYQASTTTWQAYNPFGGKSLYTFNSSGARTVSGTARAVAVSFDRPYANPQSNGFNWFLRVELPLVTWLERNGYDVTYSDDIATATRPRLLLRHRVVVVSGHDEYWSQGMRDALTRARDRGVSLAVFSSNTAFWRIRLADGGRTVICYKTIETKGAAADPVTPTSMWRDPAGPDQPENELLGSMYIGDNDNRYFPLVVLRSADPLVRNVFRPSDGARVELGSDLVGWEWDAVVDNGLTPPGVRTITASPVTGELLRPGTKTRYLPGPAVAMSTAYRAPSGALVFNAGTSQWAWGLEPNGYIGRYTGAPNAGREIPAVAQLTYNILAAMGAAPASPRASPLLVTPEARR